MFRFLPIVVLLSGLSIRTGAALPVVHDPVSGVTTVTLPAPGSDHLTFYNIYRLDEPIDLNNLSFATLVGVKYPAASNSYDYAVDESGAFHYAATLADEWGREDQSVMPSLLAGPISETCRLVPTAPVVDRSYTGNQVNLGWSEPDPENVERVDSYRVYRTLQPTNSPAPGDLVSTLSFVPRLETEVIFSDALSTNLQEIYYYNVSAVNTSGNESPFSSIVPAGSFVELEIAAQTNIVENLDTSITKMFPVAGGPETLGFTIHNAGPIACANVLVRLSAWREGESPVPFSGDHFVSIAAGETTNLQVAWTPALPGRYQVEISIDPTNQVPELDETNNQVALAISVLNRDLFFVWYGAPEELSNANVPALREDMIAEWKRRGAIAAFIGLVGPNEVDKYRTMAAAGFNGVVIDEIGNGDATTIAFLSDLADFRADYPDFFIGVWSILSPPAPVLSQRVLDGTVDLVLIERYLFVGEDVATNLQKIVLKQRNHLQSNSIYLSHFLRHLFLKASFRINCKLF